MTEEKKQEISDAVIKDDLLPPPPVEHCRCDMCQACRLIDRQRKVIEQLRDEIRTLREGKP